MDTDLALKRPHPPKFVSKRILNQYFLSIDTFEQTNYIPIGT